MIRIFVGALLCFFPMTSFADNFNSESFNIDIKCKNEHHYKEFINEDEFSWDNAYLLSEMALLPQTTDTEISTAIEKWGFDNHHVIRRKGIKPRAIIASKEDYLVLAFRGTDNIQETLADFVIITTKSGNPAFKGKVHKGFLSLYNNIREELLSKIEEYAKDEKRIYVSGHSMGSAMAIYAAHELDYLGYNVAGLYEFASPRYGDMDLTAYFKSQVFPKYNIAEPSDIVPQIPPTVNSIDSFLRLTEYLSPVLKPVAAELITKSNYGYHTPNDFHLIQSERDDEYTYAEQKDFELNYWQTLENELMSIPKASWIKHIESRTKTHPGDNYVCLLRHK